MTDIVETIGDSLIHHGPHNDRVYLMHLGHKDGLEVPRAMEELARKKGYSRLFAKVSPEDAPKFLARGYKEEAAIPPGPAGHPGLVFLSRFLTPGRARFVDREEVERNLAVARAASSMPESAGLPEPFRCQRARAEHADEIARLYAGVFETYPFPIRDGAYVRRAMEVNTQFFLIRGDGGRLVAASSIEGMGRAVEMSDFATLPEARGLGLGRALLARMDHQASVRGVRLAYTIARARSTGMNLVFARRGYVYAGTLVNSTQISGRLESMNVWYRHLQKNTGSTRG